MKAIYNLNRSVSKSDRKFNYTKVFSYLQEQEISSMDLSEESSNLYIYYRTKIREFNKSIFKSKTDYHAIISELERLLMDVHTEPLINDYLEDYIKSHVLSKISYCKYKLGQYIEAENIVENHCFLIKSLIYKGSYFLAIDLWEQIVNLNKVLVAQNKVDDCVAVWTSLFKLLTLGTESRFALLRGNFDFMNKGVFKIIKEYSILNFLDIYISGHMKFGVYPNPLVIFRKWYAEMDVNTSERLAIFRYLSLQEKAYQSPINDLINGVVDFSHEFECENYLVLRCSLIDLLVKKAEKENMWDQEKAEIAAFLKKYLHSIDARIQLVGTTISRLNKLGSSKSSQASVFI